MTNSFSASIPPFAATTPVTISRIGLKARDAERLAEFYIHLLGLKEVRRSDNAIHLGVEGRELLAITGSPAFRPDDPGAAGLFHTAFLLPARVDLARWLGHASQNGIALDGASDHLVSEAVYLNDPEGNGIEIYVDRDRSEWPREGEGVRMATERLDFDSLLAEITEGDAGWSGAPQNTIIGHVHLRVGDPAIAEKWWHEQQGFDTMAHYGDQAVFLSSGGYHHHIGANSWRSRGAGQREDDRAGLDFIELASRHATEETVSHDPWGTEIRVRPALA